MDDTAGEEDGLNEFLMSIPEVKDFRSSEKGREPQRIELYWAIHKRLVELLINEDLTDEWLLQLVELECEEKNEPDKASHIARLLTSYVTNGHWIFYPQTKFPKLQDSENYGESEISVSMGSRREKKLIHDFDNLVELLEHHKMTMNEAAKVTHATVKADQNNYLEAIQERSDILEESDTILGMAGFSPIIREPDLECHSSKPSMSTLDGSLNAEEEYINQYRSHIQILGDSAFICFLQHNVTNDEVMKMASISHARLSVDHSIKSLASEINKLQQKPGQLDDLFFIRSRSDKNDIFSNMQKQPYAEVVSIDIETIKLFIHVYGESREIFDRCLSKYLEGNHRKADLITMLDMVTGGWAICFALYSWTGATFGGLLVIGTTLFQLARHHYLRRRNTEMNIATLKELSPLLTTLRLITDSMDMGEFYMNQGTQVAVIEILHVTALVVQSLCLVVQSYLRDSMTPFHFEFLTNPVSRFVLEGIKPQLWSRKLYASSRRLSCLGDMLEKDVLVFGCQRRLQQERLDLVATTAQIVSLWGPAELVIRKNNGIPIAWNHDHHKQTEAKAITSTHGRVSIVGIKIQGGIILPTGETVHGMQQWHWKSIKHTDTDKDMVLPDIHTGIDLHTRFRIAGVGSRFSLHPIGPATWNKDCPSSMKKSVLDLHRNLWSNIRVMGAKEPHVFLKSVTAGLQGGPQYGNVVVQGNWEVAPGTPAKLQAINSVCMFQSKLAQYNQMWGLFVSFCTGVMTRVRLREVVAFFYLQCGIMEIPLVPGKTRDESIDAFVEALCGETKLDVWFESLVPKSTDPQTGEQERERLQEKVLSLFLKVLTMLKDTGIAENGDLFLACLSEDKTLNALTLSASDHPWIKVLSDSASTATFACVSLHCFPARDCTCQKDKWKAPEDFRLSTKVAINTPAACSPKDTQQNSVEAMSYWINSTNLNLIAKVYGFIKESDADSDSVCYISIKKSVLPADLIKALRKRPLLREDNSPYAIKCIISGGSKYLNQLEGLGLGEK